VVRRLHPDTQSLTPQRKEWWHQAQTAYENGDVEQLQVILSFCEIEDHGTTARTSVSLLMRITRQIKSSLRTLKSQLAEYRRDPAWNFSRLPDPGPLAERTERMLRAELLELRRALVAMESQLAMWARQAQATRPGPTFRRAVRTDSGFSY